MKQRLAEHWPKHSAPLRQATDARATERVKNLDRILAERAAKESADITRILTELQSSIRKQLEEPAFRQMELFGPEKEQLDRDLDNLHARLAAIPAEIERETEAIQARFADLQSRLFPVAVVYLVPEKMGH